MVDLRPPAPSPAQEVAPAPSQRGWLAPALLAGGALVGCAYLAAHDPNDPDVLMPLCPTKLLTGLDCPACGGLRMVRGLVTGHWSAAVHDNAVLLACLPLVAYAWVRWLVAGMRGQAYTLTISKRGACAILAVAAVWTVVRNLPGWPLKPGT